MAITAMNGVLSFGPQPAKGTAASTTFYKHRASDIDLSTISDDRLGPPEVGGQPVPTIPYRAGVVAAGGATLLPRLQNTLGWLLYGAVGAVATTANQDVLGTTVTGFFNHGFTFASDSTYLPWMTWRKYTPGTNTASAMGEVFRDTKIISFTLGLPNDGLITSRVDVLGCMPSYADPTAWTYTNTNWEDYQSIPIGCVTTGYMQIPSFSGSDLPIVAGTLTFANAPLDMRQERVYGDPYLQDITIIARSLAVDLIIKWEDPQLYKKLMTGTTSGMSWTMAPYVANLDVLCVSSRLAILTTPWQLRVRSDNVMYQMNGGIRLAGNGSVMMRLTGTVIAPTSGAAYTVNLGNTNTSYVWPT